MRGFARRGLILVVAAALFVCVPAGGGVAGAEPLSVAERARAIMEGGYERFAALPHDPPFDWRNDGCSSPVSLDPYERMFRPACLIHDFGYRNYGGRSLRLLPTEEARAWIDRVFYLEMLKICKKKSPILLRTGESLRSDCVRGAQLYYGIVRREGAPHFF